MNPYQRETYRQLEVLDNSVTDILNEYDRGQLDFVSGLLNSLCGRIENIKYRIKEERGSET